MKRVILACAVVLLAGCGSASNGVSVGTADDSTAGATGTTAAPGGTTAAPAATSASDDSTVSSIEGSDDTISVENFGDMPPQCIELLTKFLKQIEPVVSQIDWETATLGQFEAFGEQFSAESDAFDTQTSAAGCDKYNLTGTDEAQLQQMAELAAAEAPGTVGFIQFLGALSAGATANASIPEDCAGIIAEIEPFLTKGSSMNDLTMVDVTRFGQLMTGISSTCTAEESAAFFGRDDVTGFIGA